MPLSQRELVMCDRAKRLASSVDVRQVQRAVTMFDRLAYEPESTTTETEPICETPEGDYYTIPKPVPRTVVARYRKDNREIGLDYAVEVAARMLLGTQYYNAPSEHVPVLLDCIRGVMTREAKRYGKNKGSHLPLV